jgi:hypothetical protein
MTGELAGELANILSAVVTQIRGLTDDEVRALASGEAEFRVVPRKATRRAATPAAPTQPKESTVDLDPDEVRERLRAVTSEDEATAYLTDLRLTLASAKALATGLGLRLPARPTVTSINAEIIRVFVGGRLNALTVQRL